MVRWKHFGATNGAVRESKSDQGSASDDPESGERRPSRWGLGILNDKETDEVPGSLIEQVLWTSN